MKYWRLTLWALVVGLFMMSVVLWIGLSSNDVMVQDDVYYHAIRAASYIWPIDIQFPTTTVFADHPVYFYTAYYVAQAPFIALMNGGWHTDVPNMYIMLAGVKVFSAVCIGFFFASLFYVAGSNFGMRVAWLSVLFASSFSTLFVLRLATLRPFIPMIALTVWAMHWMIHKKYARVAGVSALAVFVYTVPFMLLVPAAIIGLVYRNWKIVLATVAGLVLGVLLQPDPIGYVWFAWGIHLASMVLVLLGMHPSAGGEVSSGSVEVIGNFWISALLIFGGVAASVDGIFEKITDDKRLLSFGALSIVFAPLVFLFPRGVEYFIPVFSILLAVLANMLLQEPYAKQLPKHMTAILRYSILAFIYIAVMNFNKWYDLQSSPLFSTEGAVLSLQCVGETTYYSTNFGAHPIVSFANTEATTLTGIEPAFTYFNKKIIDPDNSLFSQSRAMDAKRIEAVKKLGAKHILMFNFSYFDSDQLTQIIKSKAATPVCVRADSPILLFKIK